MKKTLCLVGVTAWFVCGSTVEAAWDEWPPRDFLLKSLVASVEGVLKTQDPQTGQFGVKPWICNDQNVLLPLAAAWSISSPDNPWHHDRRLLAAIAKGGEALVDAQDQRVRGHSERRTGPPGDRSTSRGPTAVGFAPINWCTRRCRRRPRSRWERGLRLGFTNIRRGASAAVGNMTAHNMMALYIAGICFDNADWRDAAAAYLRRVVEEQEEGGYWSEHCGPLIGYNAVYVETLGLYYHFSHDPLILESLRRAALFHASVLLPDGSAIPGIDERQLYHTGADVGNVGLSWTEEGRAYLGHQLWRSTAGGAPGPCGLRGQYAPVFRRRTRRHSVVNGGSQHDRADDGERRQQAHQAMAVDPDRIPVPAAQPPLGSGPAEPDRRLPRRLGIGGWRRPHQAAALLVDLHRRRS